MQIQVPDEFIDEVMAKELAVNVVYHIKELIRLGAKLEQLETYEMEDLSEAFHMANASLTMFTHYTAESERKDLLAEAIGKVD